ncbi:MAG TPA: SDR family NAD(P)-dependent oxidoreductase [Bacteroidales bacterium]|jgi:rhamnose utilization protein RhaD (predicted bifunctional aldolase and dehydrogenase)/NAD(P)-dependent dehydrogenase (short-subunit alcohol dehydrogenase family)|nr:SDR family NAD(P)-dependent oxidoreductase [Bacteroidales bacterium]
MRPELNDLINVSRFYGSNRDYVIAGGGNTSFKDENTLWIKASGTPLARLDEKGLVALNRDKLRIISRKVYSDDTIIREDQVKNDLYAAIIDPQQNLRPSVETSLHDLIRYRFVVHLHPSLINGILCSRNARNTVTRLFGEKALFVPYTDPGYTLFKSLESQILSWREKYSSDPQIIFLENHGSFVSGNSVDEIKQIYDEILSSVNTIIQPLPEPEQIPFNPVLNKVLPALRMMLSDEKPKVIRYRHNSLIANYYQNEKEFHKISLPLTPDIIVYCKTRYMYIAQSGSAEKILDSLRMQLPRFRDEYGYLPKVIVIKDAGILSADNSAAAADTVLEVFEDLIKVSHYSSLCGGTKALTPDQTMFIDKWEVENYRRKVAQKSEPENRLSNKTAIITGGAQGFGAGVAESLYRKGVNVVIADLNEVTGNLFVGELLKYRLPNKAIFIKTDVSDPVNVKNLVESAVKEFGGLDIMISNAGILKAGGLDEIEPGQFSRITDINYNGYFYCAKYASEVMKIQNTEKPGYFTDIIQINSKSGIRGSNRNFAYAGSKFGGIGLTQSFALELAPYRIKVNAICPGNFYEGPLWSDPKNGLFVQYLKTGKVPGAKTIEDVRKFYEDQVPLKRGCRIEDLVKALFYIIDQEYETGQAIPVTGGQVMLG